MHPLRNLSDFEKKVLKGLSHCGCGSECHSLGIAVSGGADSLSLLLSLSSIFGSEKIRVITVDHGIRSGEESGGDAHFVRNLCEAKGIKCKIVKIEGGLIEKLARRQKKSIEDLARKIRYEAFEAFIKEEDLSFLALAHNQNDQFETVLMRFLQGSGTEGLAGISRVRGKYIRPLLDISRDEIESYLIKKNQEWRTDETNFETKYLRNKVRNLLIPFLGENFPGFGKALLNGAKKARWDEEFFQLKAKDCHTDIRRRCTQIDADKKEISFKRDEFYSLHKALSRRVFVSALNEAGFGERFPFYLLDEILLWKNEKKRELSFENVKVSLDEGTLCLFVGEKETRRSCTQIDEDDEGIESGFSFVLKKPGDKAVTADFEAEVSSGEFGQVDEGFGELLAGGRKILDVKLPVLVRSLLSGDEIKTSDGKYKALSDVFTDWKVPKNLRGKIPVVEEIGEKGEIVAVLGENCGFKNWIVKK